MRRPFRNRRATVRHLYGLHLFLMERIVGVAHFGATKERRPVICIEWQLAAQSLRQIRVRDEVAAECDEVGIAIDEDRFRRIGLETTGGDDRARVMLAD